MRSYENLANSVYLYTVEHVFQGEHCNTTKLNTFGGCLFVVDALRIHEIIKKQSLEPIIVAKQAIHPHLNDLGRSRD